MKYRIHDFETDTTWYTDDEEVAYRLSFENDRYDVEIQGDTMKTYPQQHKCRDGQTYKWDARKEKPLACPRCQARLDAPKKQAQGQQD